MVHNTAQNISDNHLSYPPDNNHCSKETRIFLDHDTAVSENPAMALWLAITTTCINLGLVWRLELKLKSFPSHNSPYGGADLHFYSPQPHTIWLQCNCKSTDMELVCFLEYLFSSQLVPVPIYTAWWQEAHMCEQLFQSRYVKPSGRDLNLRSTGFKSDALTTTPPCHMTRLEH